jgi:DNA polymerase
MRLCANAVRGCIVAPPGRKLVIADLANIEGRGLAYLAGEQWKLGAFAAYDAGIGPDLYCAAYGRSFNVDPAGVKGQERQIGKVMELALGYEGGVAAFLTFAAVYNMDLAKLADAVHRTADKRALASAYGMHEWATKKGLVKAAMSQSVYVACEVLKQAWREAHPATTALWALAKEQVTNAVRNPGVTFDIGESLKARVDGNWLRMRLPSGRYLCYLQPKVSDSGEITYMGVNQYTRQWGRIKTYGGKLIENATQAFARDVMAANMPAIDEAGYEIGLTVHDEVLTETPDLPEYSVERLCEMLAAAPTWAPGIPLAAAGFETYRYRKD